MNFKKVKKISQEIFLTGSQLAAAPLPSIENFESLLDNDLTPRTTLERCMNFKKVKKISQEIFLTGSQLTAALLPPIENFEILLKYEQEKAP